MCFPVTVRNFMDPPSLPLLETLLLVDTPHAHRSLMFDLLNSLLFSFSLCESEFFSGINVDRFARWVETLAIRLFYLNLNSFGTVAPVKVEFASLKDGKAVDLGSRSKGAASTDRTSLPRSPPASPVVRYHFYNCRHSTMSNKLR